MTRLLQLGCLSLMLFSCTTDNLTTQQDETSLETITTNSEQQDTAVNSGCVDDDPVVKITNNSLSAIDVIVYNGQEEIVSAQFDIAIGEASDWLLFEAASVRVLIVTDTTSVSVPLSMDLCMAYHGTLDTDNQLDTRDPYIKS